jgi:hypothetical protein
MPKREVPVTWVDRPRTQTGSYRGVFRDIVRALPPVGRSTILDAPSNLWRGRMTFHAAYPGRRSRVQARIETGLICR